MQSKRLPMVNQVRRGNFSQGSWIGEMQQASDKSVIISEILDPRTKNLLSMSKISDYVLSNELVSMALAMVAEDQQINDVLEELFADEGNELQIRQADLYLNEGEELSFYEVLLRARQRREIVIGYRAANAEKAVINPPAKSERRSFDKKEVQKPISASNPPYPYKNPYPQTPRPSLPPSLCNSLSHFSLEEDQPKKMAVKIRLARLGCINRVFYRIHLQVVGFYDPLAGVGYLSVLIL
ncbi:ion channel CASTOR-like [Populus alba x Populus x berolinensis]|uniref:Ion channel CASTOR-like n=1 Tax=Populus alba x Populus x berolinensis TaxID=444605 RepID=A0AAD6L979_9ROSI|nr:ion channel CASTOR-like [Populus alba x Populus x berolinensis]